MGSFDVALKENILSIIPLCTTLIIVFSLLAEAISRWKYRLVIWFQEIHQEKLEEIKKELFEDLMNLESKVPDLKNKGLVRILELGVGSGSNLKYFPQQTKLVVVDPNHLFKDYFQKNKQKFPDICLEKYILGSGEFMTGVKSESVDAIVTNMILCSVENVDKILKEIHRVLVKGGRYYYLEHVADNPLTRRAQIQRFLTRFIWPTLFNGCCLNRDIDIDIAKSQFSTVDQKCFHIESTKHWLFWLLETHLVGIATK